MTVKARTDSTAQVTSDTELADALADTKVDTIYLAHGSYELSTSIDRDLTIIGNGNVVINKGHKDNGLYVEGGANLTVRGVTFAPAAGESVTTGIAIASGYTGTITVEDCEFDNVRTGIYVEEAASIEIIDCTFTNCKAGISLSGITTSATVSNDCVFTNNGEDIGLNRLTIATDATITYPTDAGWKVNEYGV